MAMAVSATRIAPEHSAIPSSLLNVCFVPFVINASFFPTAYFAHWWIFDDKGLGIPTDFCVCSRRYGSRNGCGIYAPIRRTSFSPVSSLLCNRKHSAQSWSWLELSISRRHAPFLSRPWLIARSKLSFPVYLVHWPILFGPAAALFLRLNGMAGIEVARVCAIVAGICLAFTCGMVFRSVDGRALELATALRKRMSAPSEQ